MNNYCLVYTKKHYNRETETLEEVEVTHWPDKKWLKKNNYDFKKLADKLNIKNYKIVNNRR